MGIFDGMKKSTYRREIIAYINLNTDINYREVYSEKELENITEHIFREVRSCNGSMRDFGAVFLKYVLENDKSWLKFIEKIENPQRKMAKIIKYINGVEEYITSNYLWNLEK